MNRRCTKHRRSNKESWCARRCRIKGVPAYRLEFQLVPISYHDLNAAVNLTDVIARWRSKSVAVAERLLLTGAFDASDIRRPPDDRDIPERGAASLPVRDAGPG